MTDPLNYGDEWCDVEALVLAAGGYLRPSEELRPRVLEAAHREAHERRTQRRIWQAALVIALVGVVSAATGIRWSEATPFSASVLQAHPAERQAEGGSAGWSTVESFTELRRRQAALLSLTR